MTTRREFAACCRSCGQRSQSTQLRGRCNELLLETPGADRALLYVHGDVQSPKGRAIKAQIRAAFYQEHDDWKEMVVERGHYVMKRMLRCLGES